MKIEIEVSENGIKQELQKKVSEAIRETINGWGFEAIIKKAVHETIGEAIIPEIERQLKETNKIEERIRIEIERKLKRQINALMHKNANKND